MTPRRRMLWAMHVVVLVGFIAGFSACGQRASSPYQTPSSADRNPLKGQELTEKAIELMASDPQQARELLRQALAADLFHGPAHNNLGVLELSAGQLFEAANEFEWARKLMPGHPDPRMNLAITLERAGKVDEALCTYHSALEVYPNHLPTMQAMVRLQIRHNCTDDHTKRMLEQIALSGENAQWRRWAREQLIRLLAEDQS